MQQGEVRLVALEQGEARLAALDTPFLAVFQVSATPLATLPNTCWAL